MDKMDSYIGKRIRGYAARFSPPVGGRNRLLRAAAQAADPKGESMAVAQRLSYERYHRPRHSMRSMVDWEMINPFNSSAMMMRVLL